MPIYLRPPPALAIALGVAVLAAIAPAPSAATQYSSCYAVAEADGLVKHVNFQPEVPSAEHVGVTFVGHATFLIETASGLTVATDYAGYAGPNVTPEIVTMNHAHSTHYTDHPDPAIEHVLRGWNPEGGRAEHYLELEDLRVRNVTTDIRGWNNVEPDGNSIFVFEVADLCIGHLGHLHHMPTPEQFAQIGFLDVVMAPVDGVYTMSQAEMIATLKTLRAQVVIPMHAFGPTTLAQFLAGMADEFDVQLSESHSVLLSEPTLPDEPTVLVLPSYVPSRDY